MMGKRRAAVFDSSVQRALLYEYNEFGWGYMFWYDGVLFVWLLAYTLHAWFGVP